MAGVGHNGFAAAQLQQIVARVERLEEEIKALNQDKSEVYKEAKALGFDVPQLKKVIRDRSKDRDKLVEENEIYRLYWEALHGDAEIPHTVVSRVHAREERTVSEDVARAPITAPDPVDEALSGEGQAAPQPEEPPQGDPQEADDSTIDAILGG